MENIGIRGLKGAERTKAAKACVADYNKGLTLRQVAEKRGYSVGGTRRLLLEGGVEWRQGSDARRRLNRSS